MDYFKHLPTISYGENTVKNIMARTILPTNVRNNKMIFYPYTNLEEQRSDMLSHLYYGDPGYTWLIWQTNNIIDPYFATPLSEVDFYYHVVSKYGSYDYAESTVAYYRSNWYTDTTEYTESQYDNLSSSYKKYWEPILDYNLQVKGYKRKADNNVVNTNKIVELSINYASNTEIQVGEKVKVGSSIWGWCTYSNSSVIQVQHVTGQFNANTSISGQTTSANGTITANTIIQTTIAGQDATYWESTTFLDVEETLNAARREMYLLDVTHKEQARSELKRLMSGT